MNTKLIALSAALLASTAPVNARVTGFYIGVQGGIDLAQFKVHDGTSHAGGTMTHKTPTKASYPVKMIDGDYPAGGPHGFTSENDNRSTDPYIYGSDQEVSAACPSVLAGSDDFEATPEYVYKVRPAGEIFVGYNYQVGSNFVVGVEIAGGMTFGSHKFDNAALVPDLTCYVLNKNDSKKSVTPSSDANDKEYFHNQYRATKFELETKFTGDLSLRLGCVIPGTEGRLAVFLRGGVGLARQELTFNQKSGPLYYEAIANAAYKGAAAQVYKEYATFDNTTVWGQYEGDNRSDKAGRATTASFMRDATYLSWGLDGIAGSYDENGTTVTEIQNAFTALASGNAQAGKAAIMWLDMASTYLLENATTGTYMLQGAAKTKLGDVDLNETKNRFTWHAGIDGEYHFANGLFVRASYTFKYVKGFFAEKSESVVSLTKEENKAIAKSAVTDGLFKDFLANVKVKTTGESDKLVTWIEEPSKNVAYNYTNVATLLGTEYANKYDYVPDQLSLGTLNHKIGTNEKSFSHNFSFGLGFKFF